MQAHTRKNPASEQDEVAARAVGTDEASRTVLAAEEASHSNQELSLTATDLLSRLHAILNTLTDEQREELRKVGIGRTLIWKWRHGKRLPTEIQCVDLAAAVGLHWAAVQSVVTLLKAPEKDWPRFQRAMGKALGHTANSATGESVDTLTEPSAQGLAREGR